MRISPVSAERTDETRRSTQAREPGAQGQVRPAERCHPAHQLEPRSGNRPSGKIVDSACAPTGTRGSVITTIDEEGRLLGLVTSGLTPEQRLEIVGWPDGSWLF